MRLYIAEKPDVAKAIVDALEGSFQKNPGYYHDTTSDVMVTYCFGHLLRLLEPEDHMPSYKTWRMGDLPLNLTPARYKPIESTANQLSVVVSLMKRADEIVHAGDPDAEGQLLVDEILEYAGTKKPVLRLLINDNNPKLIQKALGKLRPNAEFRGLSNAARARSIADQIYGINLTRAYTLAAQTQSYGELYSVGRVQTPILGLVVRRDQAHESHEKKTYHSVSASFAELPGVSAQLVLSEQIPLDTEGRLTDETFARSLVESCKGRPARIVSIDINKQSELPPLPHNLLTLQAEAHALYGIRPDETLGITQRLRERHRLITYNRSDCQYLSDEQHTDAPGILEAISSVSSRMATFVNHANPSHKSRAFNSTKVSAHHGIVPAANHSPASLLSQNESRIYDLIALAYIQQFQLPVISEITRLNIACGNVMFTASSQEIHQPGWKTILLEEKYEQLASEAETSEQQDFSKLNTEMKLVCNGIKVAKNQTKPVPRYTLATLLKDLTRVSDLVSNPRIKALLLDKDKGKAGERGGLGTPATRSDIIKTLFDRGFIEERKGKVVSTESARKFYDALPDSAKMPDMTALWHEQQRCIERGELTIDEFLKGIEQHVAGEIQTLRRDGFALKADEHKCTGCSDGTLQRRRGPKGIFWSCKTYPACRTTFDDKGGKPDFESRASSKYKCTECGKGLGKVKANGSTFWACSGYPSCRKTFVDQRGKPVLGAGLRPVGSRRSTHASR